MLPIYLHVIYLHISQYDLAIDSPVWQHTYSPMDSPMESVMAYVGRMWHVTVYGGQFTWGEVWLKCNAREQKVCSTGPETLRRV